MSKLHPMMAGWHFSSEELSHATTGALLLNPSLDLGVACDLNCPYCFTEDVIGTRRHHRPVELSFAETLAIADDFVEAGARTVNIVGAGEPLLHPSLPVLIERLRRSGVTTVVFTNGTKLAANQKLVDFLYEQGVTVVLKVNSRRAELQDAVVARRGYTAMRDAALQRLLDKGFARCQPTRLGVDTLAFAGNAEELPEIHRWCREANIYPLSSDFIPSGRTACGGLQQAPGATGYDPELAALASHALAPLTDLQRQVLLAALAAIDSELGVERGIASAYYGGGPCTQILGVYVDVEGAIWPCVARRQIFGPAQEPLGHVRNGDKPSVIWRRSPYLEWIRKTYSGACPYKTSLCTSMHAAASSRVPGAAVSLNSR